MRSAAAAADDGAPRRRAHRSRRHVRRGRVPRQRAQDTGSSPIIGCEAYIAPRGRFDRTVRDEAHITLLAADDEGYKNLTALISKGFLEGYYYKPRIDMDLLAQAQRAA